MNRPTNEVLGRLAFLANTRGIIPDPVNATRIDNYEREIVNTTEIVYTIPAGKVLFIDSAFLGIFNSSASANRVRLEIRDAADVYVSIILAAGCQASSGGQVSKCYPVAREVPAGYDIIIYSPAASVYATGGISGWLESV